MVKVTNNGEDLSAFEMYVTQVWVENSLQQFAIESKNNTTLQKQITIVTNCFQQVPSTFSDYLLMFPDIKEENIKMTTKHYLFLFANCLLVKKS